jgi:hypothetical protein
VGAWDSGPFDNDDALDLLGLIEDNPGEVARRLLAVSSADPGTVVDAPAASMAVAAAALVGAVASSRSTGDDHADEWLREFPMTVDAPLVDAARRAVARLRDGSELADLWDEADALDEWQASLDAIGSMLVAGGDPSGGDPSGGAP